MRTRVVICGHENTVRYATYSPDRSRVVTASKDKTARLWTANGTELAVVRGHVDVVWTARFSPDGSRVLTASGDGTARLWLANTDELIRLADSRIIRDFTPEERETYGPLLGDE